MPTPHKHAAVIKAWADGVICQFRTPAYPTWEDLQPPGGAGSGTVPAFSNNNDYRIKPEKKEGWVNIYPAGHGYAHPTKKEADLVAGNAASRIACIKITYEEGEGLS